MKLLHCTLILLIFFNGGYSLGTVEYNMFPNGSLPPRYTQLKMARPSDLYLTAINETPVSLGVWHIIGNSLLPWVTLGYLDTVFNVPVGEVEFIGGVRTSSSVTIPNYDSSSTTYTSTFWYDGRIACQIPAEGHLEIGGSYTLRKITILDRNSGTLICEERI